MKDSENTAPITVDIFHGTGIPEQKLTEKVVPLFSKLGINTVADLSKFAHDPSLQVTAEIEYGLALAHIEAIVEKFGPRRFHVLVSSILYVTSFAIFLLLGALFLTEIAKFDETDSIFSIYKGFRSGSISYEEPKIFKDERLKKFETAFHDCNQTDIHLQRYLSLPMSSEGYICMRHSFGRLNNKLQEMMNLIFFAHEFNRTLVVEREIGHVYDFTRWQEIFPHVKYRVATAGTHDLLHWCHWGYMLDGPENKFLGTHGGILTLKDKHKDKQYLTIRAEILFYYQRTNPAFIRAFHANLYPRPEILKKANDFIKENFGNKPFAAVHLRDLEASCWSRMKRVDMNSMTCSPKYEVSDMIKKTLAPELEEMPWFVASDFQKPGARNSYKDHDGRYFKGKCSVNSHECALIDFEICAQSNFFIGVYASSASRTIARQREFRQSRIGIFYPSIMFWQKGNTWEDYNVSWYYN